MEANMFSRKKVPKKYRIEDCMDNLTKYEYDIVKKLIPQLIGKSINTFNNYKNIPYQSREEIPNKIVVILEDFFGLKPRALSNVRVECKYYKEFIVNIQSAQSSE